MIVLRKMEISTHTHYITLHYITLHTTLSAFQTPPTPKVTSGASTITCYTEYSPPAQHAGYSYIAIKSGTTKKENQLCSGADCSNADCSNTHNIISSMAPHEFNVVPRTTTNEFNVIPRTYDGNNDRTRSGIMENWIKHELYHLNNEILWWHDVTHDNIMSSHDIRDVTWFHKHNIFYMSL